MMASLERTNYGLKLVEDGDRFYIEVRYRGLMASVKVYKSFQKTYEAVRDCLRRSMNCKVGEELRPYLKSRRIPKRVGASMSRQEKMLASEPRRLGVPFRQQVPLAGYLADFLEGDRIVVEVEGLQHYLDREKEIRRLKRIEECGYEVHRISSHETMENPASIAVYVRDVYLRKTKSG